MESVVMKVVTFRFHDSIRKDYRTITVNCQEINPYTKILNVEFTEEFLKDFMFLLNELGVECKVLENDL
jgi:hypothetical protein